jgi:beta-ureidopropionase / N-carbamoyl-L-amino-acid hydrolase
MTDLASLRIDLDALRQDLLDLSQIGRSEADHGIYRTSYSDADMEARRWLVERMQKEGLEAHIDSVGNVIGRLGKGDAPSVVVGSHTDTVLCAGMFDGALGVIAGLACARALRESRGALARPIEVISFAEEEGRFGGMLGAEALCGKVTPARIMSAHDADGVMLHEALTRVGLEPMKVMEARRTPESMHAYVELHVEQGPVLDREQVSIGVVEGIAGVFKWIVRLIGKASHAGTSPMNMRSDAFMGVADFAHEIPRIIDEEGTHYSRLTVGRVELKPGHPHTIAGEAEFTLVGRDMSDSVMDALANACRKALNAISRRHGLRFEYEEFSWLGPTSCHSDIIELVEKTSEKLGYSSMRLMSGAGHDAQHFADVTRSGMIFVPSVEGISHAPDEWTHWQDVEKGANVLLQAVIELATRAG